MHSREPLAKKTNARSLLIEQMVAKFLGVPLMRENVFYSAKYLDTNIEKEVCDVLLVHRDEAIVPSIKAQDKKRDADKLSLWLDKQVHKAASQLYGAHRTLRDRSFWCEHNLLGRKSFQPGQIVPRHGILVLDSDIESEVKLDLPTTDCLRGHFPITLMSVKDLLYLAENLRTWRDLKVYFDARARALCDADLRVVGAESALFGYYTAAKDTFNGCHGINDAKIVTASGKSFREGTAYRRREMLQSLILEQFIESLADAGDVDLPIEAEELRNYSSKEAVCKEVLLGDFCDLTIQERAQLGEQIGHLSQRVVCEKAPAYGTVRFGRHPDRVYVVLVAWNEDSGKLSLSAMDLTLAACVHFRKSLGIAIMANQIGNDIRYTLARFDQVSPTFELVQAAEEYFGGTQPRVMHRAR